MKIKIKDLPDHLGSSIIVKNADIPDSVYLICGINIQDNVTLELYDIKFQTLHYTALDTIEHVQKLTTDFTEALLLTKEALIKRGLSSNAFVNSDDTASALKLVELLIQAIKEPVVEYE